MRSIVNKIMLEDNYLESFLSQYSDKDQLSMELVRNRLDKSFNSYVEDIQYSLKILSQCGIDELMRCYKW